ncbi:enoyl-CoA hydratase-related protein [Micromonospora sp. DR5-3]|uniref:enoyl-CoA hydratase/isomerase family protein n=1 Tax=unclassified Micromonospora TaxID=2617518 RepID=UPI0011DBCC9A|nr:MULTISPECIES: enoyl-CoA hydratase-related protein [unclassified Micromonospora]MCW3817949.1 enoyl-CoA hydratase-related protein [Micromonospora sp. DR5-3]TYC21404.1 enoyl-CoA hydratase [Micromonospora sp. MP36]
MALRYAVSDGIATITLDRPERHNAFTFEMIADWAEALTRAQDDDEVRVVVLTGAGSAFCSGVDLDSLADVAATPLGRRTMLTRRIHKVAFAVEALDKPLLCAINGAAVGAGLDMALMCDIRFAGESARLSEGYVKVGLVPGDGGCHYLPRLVGAARALELLWTGDVLSAAEALSYGMVSRVYPDAELLPQTLAFARRLADGPPVALGLIKRAVYHGLRANDLRTSLDLIASHMGVVTATADSAEAMAAFRDRRKPRFVGR